MTDKDLKRTPLHGRHEALDLHYYLDIRDFVGKYRFIDMERDFSEMTGFLASASAPTSDEVKNRRHAVHLGYNVTEQWYVWFEGSAAKTDTRGNDTAQVEAYAPGIRYDYGPGWIYLEYLTSNGDIGRNGDIYEADFSSFYATIDYYF